MKEGKNYRTQWAGQFGTAHELIRRGYIVTFTTGNAPATDLLCRSPEGVSFSVQVKSLSTKTYFLCQDSLIKRNAIDFIVFVFLPTPRTDRLEYYVLKPPEYYVLNSEQFCKLMDEQKQKTERREKERGQEYRQISSGSGISYKDLSQTGFRDRWDILPK